MELTIFSEYARSLSHPYDMTNLFPQFEAVTKKLDIIPTVEGIRELFVGVHYLTNISVLLAKGKYDKAIKYYKEEIALRMRVLGENSLRVAVSKIHLAGM